MAVLTTRIEYAANQPPSLLGRWSSRLALFCVLLLVTALFLHRILALPTPMALNLAATAFAGALLSVIMAGVAALDIWITGRQGAARVILALVVALGLLSLPLMAWMAARDYPMIADVTTDTADPPSFEAVVPLRGAGSNPVEYAHDANAPLQQASYPDLKTLMVPRSADDTFDVVLQALAKLKLKPLSETPPAQSEDGHGTIELSDRTMMLGFRDDVVIRVMGDEMSAQVDVRSSSRYGMNDFGRNAERVRMILREIVGRLEATVPSQRTKDSAVLAKDKKKLKRPEAGSRPSAAQRPRPSPSRPASRRGPEQSASPPE